MAIDPELEGQLRPAALEGSRICARLARQLARLGDSTQVRIAKAMLKRISELTRQERELEAELAALIQQHSPRLLAEHGCGTITAAILIGHTAGARRFTNDAAFARHAGTAPIPASSGNTNRYRLHRGGDRQLNRALHIIALSRARTDPTTRAYLDRKTSEGKPNAKPSAASNATSHATSGSSSTPPTKPPPPANNPPTQNSELPNFS